MKAANAAKAEVANLEGQLGKASSDLAIAVLKNDGVAIVNANNDIKAIQDKLAAAKTKVVDIEKSTTTTPATTTGGGAAGTTTTPVTTTTGGAEDKVKAAEAAKAAQEAQAAKAVVTNLENQLNNLKTKQANAIPESEETGFDSAIAQVQGALDAAKVDAAKKDALAKSKTTTTPATTTGGGGGKTTTPATTTGGGGGKTTTPAGGVLELQELPICHLKQEDHHNNPRRISTTIMIEESNS